MGEAALQRVDPVLCHCLNVTESQVKTAIAEHKLETVKQVMSCTQAGGGCNSCHASILALIDAAAPVTDRGRPEWAQPFFSPAAPTCSVR